MAVLEYMKKTNTVFSEFECHCHSVYEIYLFLSGNCEIKIEGTAYALKPYSLILMAPNVMHGIQTYSEDDYVRCVLYLPVNELMPERHYVLMNCIPDTKKSERSFVIYENTQAFHLEKFYYYLKQLEEYPENAKTELEGIFIEALLAQINLICQKLKPSNAFQSSNGQITEIIQFINLHLTDSLTLATLSDHFYLSKNRLNSLFKSHLGTTVIEYIRYKRVVMAKQLITYEGESATNAALQVGFTDYSSFYRSYIKYLHKSPREDIPVTL